MKRREFLKKAGLGSAAVASFPTLSQVMAAPAWAESGGTDFRFVSFTDGPTIGAVKHRIGMNGNGHFAGGGVEGSGTFTHFNELSAVPKTIIAAGTWKAQRFVSFTQPAVNTWGGFVSGILVCEIRVVPDASFGLDRFSATLTVICNIGPGGISTGLPEGFTLDTPTIDFTTPVAVPTATPGVSVPLGLTVFTTANEKRGNVGP
jgi:hypothetical protein